MGKLSRHEKENLGLSFILKVLKLEFQQGKGKNTLNQLREESGEN